MTRLDPPQLGGRKSPSDKPIGGRCPPQSPQLGGGKSPSDKSIVGKEELNYREKG